MAVQDPNAALDQSGIGRVRRGVMASLEPPLGDQSQMSGQTPAAAPFAPQPAASAPPGYLGGPGNTEPPPMKAPEGMGGTPYFNGVTWVSGGDSGVVPQYGTYTPAPASTPAPPPGVVSPNPIQGEPPAPGSVPPNPYQVEPPMPSPNPYQQEQQPLGGNAALNSAVGQRLRPQMGQTRTFRNGRTAKWDGKGWAHVG